MNKTVTIDGRFCGPTRSGNGGYTCGLVAEQIDGAATVRLHVPPPLDTPLSLTGVDGRWMLADGDRAVGTGRAATLDLALPEPIDLATATLAVEQFIGFETHSFPRCFVCGPERAPGDGLRIFSGQTGQGDVVAAPWMVDASLADRNGQVLPRFVWAALDCPSAYAVLPVPEGQAIVLGELTAQVHALPRVGEACTTQAWPLEVDGRKRFAASVVHGEDGRLIGAARATWIQVDAASFGT